MRKGKPGIAKPYRSTTNLDLNVRNQSINSILFIPVRQKRAKSPDTGSMKDVESQRWWWSSVFAALPFATLS